jgi:triosephosphate isomerase (TIM)
MEKPYGRVPFVAGNWKMFKTVSEARHLISEFIPGLQAIKGVEKVFCPPFTALLAAAALLEGSDIGLGAQNMHWESSGAFTGEISPAMVSELCRYVILGHSERRTYFGETDETVNKKFKAAVAHNLIPIVCVGETLAENEAGLTNQVVSRQVHEGLAGLASTPDLLATSADSIIIAYEPIWAIGTGRAATSDGANAVLANVIRPAMADLFGEPFSHSVRILYGGSVNGSNAAEFFAQPEIDGALVGGASLKVSEFTAIIQAAGS